MRLAAKLSQAELAIRIGYSPAYISLAERAGKGLPSGRVVEAIDREVGAAGSLIALRICAETEQRALRATAASEPGKGSGHGLKLTVLVSAPTSDTAARAGFWRELARQAARMASALDPDHEVAVPAQSAPS